MTELDLDYPVEGAEAERAKAQATDVFVEAAREESGSAALTDTHGGEDRDRQLHEPAEGELERACRR